MNRYFITFKKFLIAGFAIIALTTENYQARPKVVSYETSMEVSKNASIYSIKPKLAIMTKIIKSRHQSNKLPTKHLFLQAMNNESKIGTNPVEIKANLPTQKKRHSTFKLF